MSRRCPTCGTSFPDKIFYCGHDGTITIQEQDPSDVDPRLGKQLGEYIVVARVADGAMGRVYEGRHPETRERVAIKVLHEPVMRDTIAVERFKREYETAQDLDHVHVVKVHEFGTTDVGYEALFMTMEYLLGEELGLLLERDGAQPLSRAIRIMCQTALGLAHAHSFGVIHRDLKPDNIFLCHTPEGDVVKLLDFGSVKLQMETGPKLTAFGTTLGSPYYMSPEQAMGKFDVDQRTDVFAMAAITYEMIEGRVPFEGKAVAQILMKLVNEDPAPMSRCPPALATVIARGLSKDKTLRPNGAVELAQEMVDSLGLGGTVEQWAHEPLSALTEALARSVPPPSAPVFAPPAPTAAPFGESAPVALGGFDSASLAPQQPRGRPALSPVVLLVGLGVAGLITVGGLLAAYLMFMG